MLNPFGQQQDSGAYVDLKKRMLQRVQSSKVNDQIFKVVQESLEDALKAEYTILSRPEKKRLLSQILKLVLDDMLQKLDDRSSSA